jgi:hypothetical protein
MVAAYRALRRHDLPALQGIHKFARCFKALAHDRSLLADGDQGIFEQSGLVLCRRWRGHDVARAAGTATATIPSAG